MVEQNAALQKELIQGLQGFMAFVKNPNNIESVFDIAEALGELPVTAASVAYLKSKPDAAAMFAERYIAPTPDLHHLLTLPQNSLGFIYGSKMTAANLDPDFYRQVEIKDDVTYLMLRVRQTHDIWHTVTGFGIDVYGEIGLQAFQLAQNRSPIAVMLMAGALLSTIQYGADVDKLMRVIAQGYNMGLNAKLLFAQKWEEHWEKPLAEWRSELNIVPANS